MPRATLKSTTATMYTLELKSNNANPTPDRARGAPGT